MKTVHRVLLVEDNPPLRRSLENYLERAGYICDSCSTAWESFLLTDEHSYDIVIAEYLLPDANGAELLRKLLLKAPHMETILLSQFDFQWVAENLPDFDLHCFLKKPFDLDDFEMALTPLTAETRPRLPDQTESPDQTEPNV